MWAPSQHGRWLLAAAGELEGTEGKGIGGSVTADTRMMNLLRHNRPYWAIGRAEPCQFIAVYLE